MGACGENYVLLRRSDGVLLIATSEEVGSDEFSECFGAEEKVDIMDIAAGQTQYLALDKQHRVWRGKSVCFLRNWKRTKVEKCVFFEEKKVVEIGCGKNNSFCRTEDGVYYVKGSWPDRNRGVDTLDPVQANE